MTDNTDPPAAGRGLQLVHVRGISPEEYEKRLSEIRGGLTRSQLPVVPASSTARAMTDEEFAVEFDNELRRLGVNPLRSINSKP